MNQVTLTAANLTKLDEEEASNGTNTHESNDLISSVSSVHCEAEQVDRSLLPEGYEWYFAFGSNMNVAQLLSRVGAYEGRRAMRLPNYCLVFNKKVAMQQTSNVVLASAGYANIVPCEGDAVYGISYGLTAAQLAIMDRFEGVSVGHYHREELICLDVESGIQCRCIGYVAESSAVQDGLQPLDVYMSNLLAGRGLLPPEYVEKLESYHCLSDSESKKLFC